MSSMPSSAGTAFGASCQVRRRRLRSQKMQAWTFGRIVHGAGNGLELAAQDDLALDRISQPVRAPSKAAGGRPWMLDWIDELRG
jgi:hypothetical protein